MQAGQTTRSDALLEIKDVAVRFGGIVALDGVSFTVRTGQICGLIGPNGSGKTTLFNCISGIYRPNRGDLYFSGRSIVGVARHARVGLGIGRTFQNVALFPSMTVNENVLVGAHGRFRTGYVANTLNLPEVAREEAEIGIDLAGILADLGLEADADRVVAGLPFGTRKRVELARALIGRPKLLLLDEPAAGLTHGEVDALGDLIIGLRDRYNLSVLLVEHHMALVMRVSEQVVAMEFGRCIACGTPEQVRCEPEVIRAYLGDTETAHAA